MQYATAKTKEARKARKNLTNVSPEDLNGFGPWVMQVLGAISVNVGLEVPASYTGPRDMQAASMELIRLTSVPGAQRPVAFEPPAKNFPGRFIAHGHCEACAREVFYPALEVCERCGVAVWCSETCRAAGAKAHAAACADCSVVPMQCRREYRDGGGRVVAVGHCTFIFLGKGKLKGAAKIVPVGAGDELCRAAYVGDVGALGRLLDGGAPVDGRDGWGETPLGRAATRGRVDAVRLLLGRGASADAADDGGRAARLLLGTQTGTQPAKAPKEAATWQEKQREYERKKARAKEFRLRLTCTICGAKPKTLLNCPCGTTQYCSTDCQRIDWRDRGHRQACKKIRNERAAEAARAEAPTPPPSLPVYGPAPRSHADEVRAHRRGRGRSRAARGEPGA
ncbi:hypothetical protein JL722_2864 [Aureococcus anophagefferens]|nr:hypothetical protein JL722_2864 [Aureococcus anophagefferens]